MAEWLPIESAPKDGTRVLLGRYVAHKTYGNPGKVRASYANAHWFDAQRGWLGDYSGPNKRNKNWCSHAVPFHPTHWMPLPAPPLEREDV